ncbi:MAG: penicillin acylase family protein [Deltaproteobacteria bacterium]|nr:MAG: penicillin acylase family protein [Deltaproteobacteria bacterium]
MKLKGNTITLNGPEEKIHLERNSHGIPVIAAKCHADLAYGLGWIHAHDRQIQSLLMKTLFKGQAAEKLKGEDALIEIDKYMRRMNFLPDPDQQIKKLTPETNDQLTAYAKGFNDYLLNNKTVYELRLIGYTPEPWEILDCLLVGKVFGFIGLADAQGSMEKFLVQMIQNDVNAPRIKELFPYLTEDIDSNLIKKILLDPPMVPEARKWLGALPKLIASNSWAVSGTLTESGKPILCGDPHLEVNRLPAIWQEIVMTLPDNKLMGASIPGLPGLILGRTNDLAWSATYSFMDMLDYRIEHCRDGKYRRNDGWKPFVVRREIINVKNSNPVELDIFENEHGVLEGTPDKEGYYLVLNWSAKENCGADDVHALLAMADVKTVKEAMDHFKRLDAPSFNWVIADSQGNIGYQMSGRCFDRPDGVSGLLPLPGWEERYDYTGYIAKDKLPASDNPAEGIIVTANQDLNHLGQANPINLPMGTYRADRIRQLLTGKAELSVDDMKHIQFDLYSLQAERLMEMIRPLLPDTENGIILKRWDLRYDGGSKGAMLFESVYLALIKVVFGDGGIGRDVVSYILKQTSLFNDYYANFDNILFQPESAWFKGEQKESLFKRAIAEGLSVQAVPYGKTRKIMLSHILFGGKIPSFVGYDRGPMELPGSRATIPQGQIFNSVGRTTTFSPSYRFIADMGTEEMHTNLAGGPTDRRFSKWYKNDLKNWLDGNYKVLK